MIRHGKWTIRHDPTPLPTRAFDWSYVHDDIDGAPDGNDTRCGCAESPEACIAAIEERDE